MRFRNEFEQLVQASLEAIKTNWRNLQSIQTRILLMTISVVVSSFLIVGVIGSIALGGMVSGFMAILHTRSVSFLEVLTTNSEKSKDRLVKVFEENARVKGENLLQKDSLVLKVLFLENAFSGIRSNLQSSFDFDRSIRVANFIVVEDGEIKAWQYIDRKHGKGLPIPIVFDKKTGAWQAKDQGKAVSVNDPTIKDITQIKGPTIRRMEVETTDGSGVVPAYEAIIPIFDGAPDELDSLLQDGSAVAYLRYVISLEQLVDTVKTQETELSQLLEEQKANSARLQRNTMIQVAIGIGFTFLILLATAAGVIFLAAGVSMLLSRMLTKPVAVLSESAHVLSNGNLDAHIDTSRKDELGHLAVSFDTMRNSIRKKITDLKKLNEAGETIAFQKRATDIPHYVMRTLSQHFGARSVIYIYQDQYKRLTLVKDLSDQRDYAWILQLVSSENLTEKDGLKVYKDRSEINGNSIVVASSYDDNGIDGYYVLELDKSRSLDSEDIGFIESIVRMAKVRSDNLLMVDTIITLNSSLEQKVAEQTRDIRSMLENTKIGLMSITKDLKVHKDYAKYLETIVEQPSLSDKDFVDVLLRNSKLGPDEVGKIMTALEYTLGEDELYFTVNAGCFPREIEATFGNTSKVLDLDWSPVLDANGRVEKVLLSVRDVTETLRLRKEAEQGRRSLKMLSEVLEVGPEKYLKLEKEVKELLADFQKYMPPEFTRADEGEVRKMYVALHTLKGLTRMYKFGELTDIIHLTEDITQKHKVIEGDHLENLRNCVTRLGESLVSYQEAFRPLLNIKQQLEKMKIDQDPYNIYNLLGEMGQVANELARDIGKAGCNIEVDLPDHIIIEQGLYEAFSKSLIHLVRNTVDHGLEMQEERLGKGKSAKGLISVRMNAAGQLVYFDDGRGLNLKKIREKAERLGMPVPSDPEHIAELIFSSGFSTAEETTDISGRGVGLDAVRMMLEQTGSSIGIRRLAIVGDYMKFEFVIGFPHRIHKKLSVAS